MSLCVEHDVHISTDKFAICMACGTVLEPDQTTAMLPEKWRSMK